MSDVTFVLLDGDTVPRPSTQVPLHGAQTPTIAPDESLDVIASATALSSAFWVSAGNR